MGNIFLEDVGGNLSDMMEDRGIASAQQLIDRMGDSITTRTVNKHRGGEAEMKISQLDKYCAFFGCSADHMLGYIKEETHALTDVHEATGLSSASIKSLAALKEANPEAMKVLDFLLCSSDFADLLERVRLYSTDVKSYHYYYDARYHNKKESLKDSEVRRLTTQMHASRMYMNAAFTGIINQWEKIAEDYVTEYRK